MLPDWVNSLGTVVTPVTGVPVIIGWLVSQTPPLRPPVTKARRPADTGHMVRDALHERVVLLVIRPEQPLREDVLAALFLSVLLVVLSAFWAWNATRPIELAWDGPFRTIAVAMTCGLGLIVCAVRALLFAKQDYLKRLQRGQ